MVVCVDAKRQIKVKEVVNVQAIFLAMPQHFLYFCWALQGQGWFGLSFAICLSYASSEAASTNQEDVTRLLVELTGVELEGMPFD